MHPVISSWVSFCPHSVTDAYLATQELSTVLLSLRSTTRLPFISLFVMKTLNTSKETASLINLSNIFKNGMDTMSAYCLALEQEQYEENQDKSLIRECLDGIAALHLEAVEMNQQFA